MNNGFVAVWDTETWELRRTLEHKNLFPLESITFSPDSLTLVSVAYADAAVKIWDLKTGQVKHVLPKSQTEHVNGPVFSQDGQILVYGGQNSLANVWDSLTGKLKKTPNGAQI